MLAVTTVNVNGIRAAARKGFADWLQTTESSVVLLQEVRATDDQVPAEVRAVDGWHMALASAAAKGRAGVAIMTRTEPSATRVGFESAEFDDSGRYIEVDLPGLTVGSLYLPSGEAGTPRQDEKERFMAEFADYLKRLKDRAAKAGREVLVCGDWNIAHREADLKNWKTNQKSAGFLPGERAWLGQVFDGIGYVDVVRRLHPEGPGPYSWWSMRGKAFDNDAGWRIDLICATPGIAAGWRIDLICATPGIAARAVNANVERAASYAERWSDHAPVTAVFDR